MEMLLFLNESYIFHLGFVCGVLFYGTHIRMPECRDTNYRVPECLINPFLCLLEFPLSVKRISEF
ncbi:BTE_collapsed_G0027970.mRNA.1.CDS.1 [Saccharomyces cerevisiae]|nr:BTE_collapsed_G0027970.mRNA.1.CDS.1 [Saccharomyces cerevisiae]